MISIDCSPETDAGLFTEGRVVAGVGLGLGRPGVGEGRAGVGAGVAPVLAFAGGVRGVGVGFGVVTGTGQSNKPLGVTVQPAGISCINGLCPGGRFNV